MSDPGLPVLVVGAGPSGLFAAVELARHGVRSRVVEREPRPHRQARATALQPGTLEILGQAEALDRVLAESVHLRFARLFDAGLRTMGEMAFAGAGCPWEYQCSLPQWWTEQILAERLVELGGVVQRGVAAASIEPREDGVLVRLEHADGAVETVEMGMDEILAGGTYPGIALVADVRVSCRLPRDGSALIASPEGYVMLAPLPDERWIAFVGELDDGEAERVSTDTSIDAVAATIERRVASGVRVEEVAWASPFRMHHRLVSRLADRRCFLLGDAGHLSSPFGGEGLNSGLHDAHNLAWKLGLELRGRSRPGLVGSYASERISADRHVLEVSDRLHGLARGAVESMRTGVRADPPTPDQTAALVRSRSMLDVSYAGSPLVGEYLAPGGEAPPPPVPGDRYPDRTLLAGTKHHLLLFGAADDAGVGHLCRRWDGLVDVAEATGDPRRAGLLGPGTILVRPDGHIGFRATATDSAALGAVDAHLGSYLLAV